MVCLGKSIARVILPAGEPDWYNRSSDKDDIVAIGKPERQVRTAAHWQQATIEITRRNHTISAWSCHIYGFYSLRTSRSWWIAHSTQCQPRGCNNIPSFYNELHQTHIHFLKDASGMTFTSWSQHHFVAIGKPKQQIHKASHCGSKRSREDITLPLLVCATYTSIWLLFFASCTSRSWRITHSTQRHSRGCNNTLGLVHGLCHMT